MIFGKLLRLGEASVSVARHLPWPLGFLMSSVSRYPAELPAQWGLSWLWLFLLLLPTLAMVLQALTLLRSPLDSAQESYPLPYLCLRDSLEDRVS